MLSLLLKKVELTIKAREECIRVIEMMSTNEFSPTVLGDAAPSKENIEAVNYTVNIMLLGWKATQ